jgi:hypothetical protein
MSSLIQILVLGAAISDRDIAHRSGNQSDTFEVGLGNLKLVYSRKEGKLTQYINRKIMVCDLYDTLLVIFYIHLEIKTQNLPSSTKYAYYKFYLI